MSVLRDIRQALVVRLQTINGSSPYSTSPTITETFPFRPDQRAPVPAIFVRRAGWTSNREGIAMSRRGRSVSVKLWAFGKTLAELEDLVTDIALAVEATPGVYGITSCRLVDAPTLTEGDDYVMDPTIQGGSAEGIEIVATFPCDTDRGVL